MSQALDLKPAAKLPVASDEQPGSIFAILARAAADPAVNVDKMKGLYELMERSEKRDAERAFDDALNAAQSEMRPISADATNPQTKSKYATYAKLDRVIRPIYTQHGFSISYDEQDSPKPDYVRVVAYVSRTGYTRTYRRDMPADGKGAKGGDVMTKTHASGAAQSYGMRYLLKGIFNIAVGDDDEDGNEPNNAGANEPISEAILAEFNELIERTGANIEAFCKYLGVESLKALTNRDAGRARQALNEKLSKLQRDKNKANV